LADAVTGVTGVTGEAEMVAVTEEAEMVAVSEEAEEAEEAEMVKMVAEAVGAVEAEMVEMVEMVAVSEEAEEAEEAEMVKMVAEAVGAVEAEMVEMVEMVAEAVVAAVAKVVEMVAEAKVEDPWGSYILNLVLLMGICVILLMTRRESFPGISDTAAIAMVAGSKPQQGAEIPDYAGMFGGATRCIEVDGQTTITLAPPTVAHDSRRKYDVPWLLERALLWAQAYHAGVDPDSKVKVMLIAEGFNGELLFNNYVSTYILIQNALKDGTLDREQYGDKVEMLGSAKIGPNTFALRR
jgi:hypothetical protein